MQISSLLPHRFLGYFLAPSEPSNSPVNDDTRSPVVKKMVMFSKDSDLERTAINLPLNDSTLQLNQSIKKTTRITLAIYRLAMFPLHIAFFIWLWHLYGDGFIAYMSYLCILWNVFYFACCLPTSVSVLSEFLMTGGLHIDNSIVEHQQPENEWALFASEAKDFIMVGTIVTDMLVSLLYWMYIYEQVISAGWNSNNTAHIITSITGHIFNLVFPLFDVFLECRAYQRRVALPFKNLLAPLFIWHLYMLQLTGYILYRVANNIVVPKSPYKFVDDVLMDHYLPSANSPPPQQAFQGKQLPINGLQIGNYLLFLVVVSFLLMIFFYLLKYFIYFSTPRNEAYITGRKEKDDDDDNYSEV